jgi:hypothetical protein
MPRRLRTKLEREANLTEIKRLDLQGFSCREIERILGIPYRTVAHDKQRLAREYKQERLALEDQARHIERQRLYLLLQEAFTSWHKSKERKVACQGCANQPPADPTVLAPTQPTCAICGGAGYTIEIATGNPAFLNTAHSIVRSLLELDGVCAPQAKGSVNVHVNQTNVQQSVTIEDIMAEVKRFDPNKIDRQLDQLLAVAEAERQRAQAAGSPAQPRSYGLREQTNGHSDPETSGNAHG